MLFAVFAMYNSKKLNERGNKMLFDYSKLRGKIREKFETQSAFAKELGISNASLSSKLNNHVEFSQLEMNKCCELLKIPKEFIPIFFYTKS